MAEAEVPLMDKVINPATGEDPEDEAAEEAAEGESPEEHAAEGTAGEAAECVEHAEQYATDTEAIAGSIKAASAFAKEARTAADEAAEALPACQEAEQALAVAKTKDPEGTGQEVVEAQRVLEDSCRAVHDAEGRAEAALKEALKLLPQISPKSLMEWAEQATGGGAEE